MEVQTSNYTAFNLPRLDGFFEEPSFYSRFLLLFLPLIYAIGGSKLKIHNNKIINFIIKKTLIALTLINLILTQSPIYIIFLFIVSTVYYRKEIIILIRKHIVFCISAILILLVFTSRINFSETFIVRIINVVSSIKDFQTLILAEPSLGTRIVNFANQMSIFFKHPILGVGIGDIGTYMFQQTMNSTIPITGEIVSNLELSIRNNVPFFYNSALVYSFLASNGIFIFLLLCRYHYKIYKLLTKIKFKSDDYYHQVISRGLEGCWFVITLLCFYHLLFISVELWILYSIILSFILKYLANGKGINYE